MQNTNGKTPTANPSRQINQWYEITMVNDPKDYKEGDTQKNKTVHQKHGAKPNSKAIAQGQVPPNKKETRIQGNCEYKKLTNRKPSYDYRKKISNQSVSATTANDSHHGSNIRTRKNKKQVS